MRVYWSATHYELEAETDSEVDGLVVGVGEFFPPRFWGLDPLFSAKVKLNIGEVLSLSHYPDFPGQGARNDHDYTMLSHAPSVVQ